ncbi:DinB family protein [Nocardioides fonticola]|uniref:DinB family protein n=1 Tax=Nocardioides fonticola TaxID=450363 RepID=A0ABP7Y041_9ACTN
MTETQPETFLDRSLRGARFDRCDLSGVVMRGVDVAGLDLDSPWLDEGEALLVNGVDVVPYVEAELDRRFPGRSLRTASDPAGLLAAWDAVEAAWAAAVERAEGLPAEARDRQVDGEWSFAQTLRHLVMATDVWLRGAVLGIEQPYHPLGQPNAEFATDGYDTSVFADGIPAWADVLAARASRQELVRAFIADVTAEELTTRRTHPWSSEHTVDVLHCLHTILREEWEHLRFAVRDLDALGTDLAARG